MTGSTAARASCWWWTRIRAGDDPRSHCGYSRPCEHPHRIPTPPCWPECPPHSQRSRWCWRCSAGGGADCEGRTSWWRSPPLPPISTEVSSMNLPTHRVVRQSVFQHSNFKHVVIRKYHILSNNLNFYPSSKTSGHLDLGGVEGREGEFLIVLTCVGKLATNRLTFTTHKKVTRKSPGF